MEVDKVLALQDWLIQIRVCLLDYDTHEWLSRWWRRFSFKLREEELSISRKREREREIEIERGSWEDKIVYFIAPFTSDIAAQQRASEWARQCACYLLTLLLNSNGTWDDVCSNDEPRCSANIDDVCFDIWCRYNRVFVIMPMDRKWCTSGRETILLAQRLPSQTTSPNRILLPFTGSYRRC